MFDTHQWKQLCLLCLTKEQSMPHYLSASCWQSHYSCLMLDSMSVLRLLASAHWPSIGGTWCKVVISHWTQKNKTHCLVTTDGPQYCAPGRLLKFRAFSWGHRALSGRQRSMHFRYASYYPSLLSIVYLKTANSYWKINIPNLHSILVWILFLQLQQSHGYMCPHNLWINHVSSF